MNEICKHFVIVRGTIASFEGVLFLRLPVLVYTFISLNDCLILFMMNCIVAVCCFPDALDRLF